MNCIAPEFIPSKVTAYNRLTDDGEAVTHMLDGAAPLSVRAVPTTATSNFLTAVHGCTNGNAYAAVRLVCWLGYNGSTNLDVVPQFESMERVPINLRRLFRWTGKLDPFLGSGCAEQEAGWEWTDRRCACWQTSWGNRFGSSRQRTSVFHPPLVRGKASGHVPHFLDGAGGEN